MKQTNKDECHTKFGDDRWYEHVGKAYKLINQNWIEEIAFWGTAVVFLPPQSRAAVLKPKWTKIKDCYKPLLLNLLYMNSHKSITAISNYYGEVIMGAMASQIPASRMFTQPFIRAQIKENIKAPRHWTLCGEFTGEFSAQIASYAENVSIWWRHHVLFWFGTTAFWVRGSQACFVRVIINIISHFQLPLLRAWLLFYVW